MKKLLLVAPLSIPFGASAHGLSTPHLHGGDWLGLCLIALIATALWWARSRP